MAECVRYRRRGACPPPPTPPASGMVPVPGWVVGWTELDGRRGPVGIEPRKYEGSSRFFAERAVRISAPLRRMPSRYRPARECLTAGAFEGRAVRGETRHQVPLSLPRPPLFPDRFAELATGTSTAPRPSHRLKRGLYFPHIPVFSRAQARPVFPPQPGFLAGTSAVSISTATRLSHGNKRGQRRERM